MVRWRLQNMFPISSIFYDFLATKAIQIPISFSKLILVFSFKLASLVLSLKYLMNMKIMPKWLNGDFLVRQIKSSLFKYFM